MAGGSRFLCFLILVVNVAKINSSLFAKFQKSKIDLVSIRVSPVFYLVCHCCNFFHCLLCNFMNEKSFLLFWICQSFSQQTTVYSCDGKYCDKFVFLLLSSIICTFDAISQIISSTTNIFFLTLGRCNFQFVFFSFFFFVFFPHRNGRKVKGRHGKYCDW